MKSTVLIFSALIVVLSAGILFEHLRKVSRLRLTAGVLAMIASAVVLWDVLPARAKHDIGRRADAVRIAIQGQVAEIADEVFAARSKPSCPPGQVSARDKCVASIDDAARTTPSAHGPCKTNEYFSRFSKTCVPEWNVRLPTESR
jgi:hypothetical protein